MTGKELLNKLKKDGWTLDRISGSHHIMKKDGCIPVSVPVHGKKDLKPGTLNDILKDANLK